MSYGERAYPSGATSIVRKIFTIVSLINSRDSHTSIFALSLLDVLVKNCGYPFHLQISRKEFLNELVKRFPERPPIRYSRPQRLILGQIEEWNQTLCKTSKYKEDLGFIRDMHRLLSYKGYVFPEVKAEDASVLNPSDNLKSAAEIQKEEAIAQAAKLQELVRRGRPSDLKEANKLMKIMAGFKDDNLVDSKAQVAEDLDRLKRKADIFNEMLATSEKSGSLDTSDETLVELYSALKVAQPKIQKIIEEEQDDEESVQDLLKINDTVNSLVEKYNFLKNGDLANASKVQVANAGSGVQQSLNLIDFDDDVSPEPTGENNNNNNNGKVDDLLGDLSDLSFGGSSNQQSSSSNNFGSGGDITLDFSSNQPSRATSPNYDIFNQLSNNNTTTTSTTTPANPTVSSSNQNAFASLDTSLIGSFGGQQQQQSNPRSLVNESQHLKFELELSRDSQNTVSAKAIFSNIGTFAISNLQFLIAVPKSLSLRLEPQSGSFLGSFAKDAVTQSFKVDSTNANVPPKIKWKVNYIVNGSDVEETNTYTFNV
ncbi:ADP-ribosylation factor-binding protein [Wickerhamomyces ciferrii]|uniref:ADP-ribosylation factor-binding protein n=1 Tax=Wickerhamomyces ciferrii (strain ATCC 14091 / BCRC 22168 / CBS 111 / JCM 3599 / NBRC 0793 / NRRL Y-1031 F-60-10) TaxID=1206466 RepID=K0KQW2_WICCF|nr:ADP-ribosylation factor-binding protein [Wickerhamomyces ciferrii]CCH45491.1 ADP-ribosylation factor-binding protein [Wickerhamomyces ciferrii]